MTNVAIFVSGNGTNCENIIQYFKDSKDVRISLVISNKSEAYALVRAANNRIPTVVVSKQELNDEAFTMALMQKYSVDFIVLAGFLMMIPSFLITHYDRRIINIHPSLLPKHGGKGMYGIRVQEAVLAAGDKEAGCTVHYVSAEVDGGGIIAQEAIAVAADDTPESLAERVQQAEKALLPQVVGNFVEG
jgi:phosphoribosylglycinamide formyltransferase-1